MGFLLDSFSLAKDRQNFGFNMGMEGPFDIRSAVEEKANLTDANIWSNLAVYKGMIVSTAKEGDLYILVDIDVTKESSWKLIGSGDYVEKKDILVKNDDGTYQNVVKVESLGYEGDDYKNLLLFNKTTNMIDSKFIPGNALKEIIPGAMITSVDGTPTTFTPSGEDRTAVTVNTAKSDVIYVDETTHALYMAVISGTGDDATLSFILINTGGTIVWRTIGKTPTTTEGGGRYTY